MSLADQQWCPTSVQVTVLQARGLRIKGKSGTNDAYAVMQVGKEKYQTSVVEKSVAPVWREEAAFDLPPLQQGGGGGGTERSTLHVHVLHRALVGPDKLLGQAVVNLLQLSEDTTRNKTEWFKLLDKTGKADKDRGEVLVDIQFLRNNMTASMFDLSAAGKSKSRLGKFKDKVRGKKKESDAASVVVPSFSQVLTDSEEEGNGDDEVPAGKDEKKKKLKMKSLFSPKSNLQRNMSQSMSVLPAKNSSLSGSLSSGLNVDSSEGKKKFKFMKHKRSGSSDSKESSSGQKHGAAEQNILCINGSHVYCEEPQSRTSRIGSNFSLTSSGHGSMEDVPESSPPSVDSLRAVRQYSPWTEEEEEEETTEVENIEEDVGELRREEEERVRRQEEELERLTEEKKRQEEEKRRVKQEEEERIRREEEERAQAERRRQEEEERVRREEEERERLAEENRRLEEQEIRRIEEEEKRLREEGERLRMEEEERMRQEENKLAEEKRRLEKERRRIEEEKVRKQEEKRAQEERMRREEEEMVRRQEKELEEKRRLEEQERQRKEEEIIKEKERRQEEEEKARWEKDEYERLVEEKRKLEEEERKKTEEEEKLKREEEERIRVEEEKRAKEEEEERVRRQEEEREKLAEQKRILEEQEGRRIEEEEKRQRAERIGKEEERMRKEEEKERVRRQEKEEVERLAEEKRRREEDERRRTEEEKVKREEEERIRKKEDERAQEERRKEEEERVRKENEEMEKLAEENRRLEEQEMKRTEEEERVRREEKAEMESKEEQARKLDKEKIDDAEEQKRRENNTKHKAAEMKSKVAMESPAEVTSTNPFDENFSNNPFEEIHSSPAGPDSSTAQVSTVRQRCQSAESSVGSKTVSTDEKDLISSQREKRPAPQPPGRNQAERQSQKEQDGSTPHLAQINKQSKDKDVKTVSVLPQRSVQIILPLSRKGTTNVAKHSKRPAPSKPRSVEEGPSSAPKAALSSDGNISHDCGLEAKQEPTVYGLNPFEDDEDENELTVQDDTTSGKTALIQWPPAMSQGAEKDTTSQAKIKSSKVARAPPLPTTKATTSSTLISQNTEGGHATDKTGVMGHDNRVTHACVPESISPLHVQESPSAGEEASGKKEGPPTASRRLQPVKPLNPLEQQAVSVVGGEKDNKSTGILCGDQKNTKVNDTGLKGPFSQLTQEELISLVLKQKKQLSERDKKISELEQYIDNLLVRVIEEQPSILMSMNSLKKSV